MARQRVISIAHSFWVNMKLRLLKSTGRMLTLLLLILIFSVFTRHFFTLSNLVNILRQVSTNAIIAFGLTFILLTGGIDLSIGAIVAVSGCLSAGLLQRGCPTIFAVVLSVLSGCIFGLVNGWIITSTGIPAFLVTLATMTVGYGIASVYTSGKSIMIHDEAFLKIGNGSLGPVSYLIIYLLVFLLLSELIFHETSFGHQVRAIGDNRESANFMGLGVKRIERFVYAYSGALDGVVGIILASRLYSGQPLIGDGAELDGVAAVVIGGTSLKGGIGSIGGTLIGALIIGTLNNGLNLLQIQSYWQQILKGSFLIIAACFDTLHQRK